MIYDLRYDVKNAYLARITSLPEGPLKSTMRIIFGVAFPPAEPMNGELNLMRYLTTMVNGGVADPDLYREGEILYHELMAANREVYR